MQISRKIFPALQLCIIITLLVMSLLPLGFNDYSIETQDFNQSSQFQSKNLPSIDHLILSGTEFERSIYILNDSDDNLSKLDYQLESFDTKLWYSYPGTRSEDYIKPMSYMAILRLQEEYLKELRTLDNEDSTTELILDEDSNDLNPLSGWNLVSSSLTDRNPNIHSIFDENLRHDFDTSINQFGGDEQTPFEKRNNINLEFKEAEEKHRIRPVKVTSIAAYYANDFLTQENDLYWGSLLHCSAQSYKKEWTRSPVWNHVFGFYEFATQHAVDDVGIGLDELDNAHINPNEGRSTYSKHSHKEEAFEHLRIMIRAALLSGLAVSPYPMLKKVYSYGNDKAKSYAYVITISGLSNEDFIGTQSRDFGDALAGNVDFQSDTIINKPSFQRSGDGCYTIMAKFDNTGNNLSDEIGSAKQVLHPNPNDDWKLNQGHFIRSII
jgi:hypothetical protein